MRWRDEAIDRVAATHFGIATDEFEAIVRTWLATAFAETTYSVSPSFGTARRELKPLPFTS